MEDVTRISQLKPEAQTVIYRVLAQVIQRRMVKEQAVLKTGASG